jgi:hypothetical protein
LFSGLLETAFLSHLPSIISCTLVRLENAASCKKPLKGRIVSLEGAPSDLDIENVTL